MHPKDQMTLVRHMKNNIKAYPRKERIDHWFRVFSTANIPVYPIKKLCGKLGKDKEYKLIREKVLGS